MNDIARTAVFVIVAVVLAGAAWLLQPAPPDLEQFSDQGEAFYPDFSDPLLAASLEVIDYDEASGTARPFRVQVVDGVWSIPSHYDYPADGEERLASTAAAMIDLRKDVVQSDRVQDHEALGVIDPLDDTTPSLVGRGQRVTLRDAGEVALADFIIGNTVPDKQGFRYVRVPDRKRTYAVKVEVDPSTRFADWIETDVLEATAWAMSEIDVSDYSIDETTGQVDVTGIVRLGKTENEWAIVEPPAPEGKALDGARINAMTTAIAGLTITGVRPKPAGLSANLEAGEALQIDLPTRMSLESKGYFISPDGRLLSNEGEVTVGTTEGVRYTLRFGEVLLGEGRSISAGEDTADDAEADPEAPESATEHRYLFVTANFDESLLPPRPVAPEPPAEAVEDPEAAEELEATGDDGEAGEEAESIDPAIEAYELALADHERALVAWQEQADASREKANALNARFADWYYVISAADFQDVRPSISDLLVDEQPEG